MKVLITTILFLCAIGFTNSQFSSLHQLAKDFVEEKYHKGVTKVNKCEFCLEVVDNVLQDVLNLILNAGVATTCQTGCAIIAQKLFNSSSSLEQLVQVACTFGCLIVGMKEFVKILEEINLDPIYYCEEMNLCAFTDNGKAKIDKVTVSPLSGAQGTTFDIEIDYTVINTTGTGDLVLEIHTVDHLPLSGQAMLYQQAPGSYGVKFKVDASPNPDCNDPMCEQWLPGVYPIDIALCDGECSGKHPHSKTYDSATANFTLTG